MANRLHVHEGGFGGSLTDTGWRVPGQEYVTTVGIGPKDGDTVQGADDRSKEDNPDDRETVIRNHIASRAASDPAAGADYLDYAQRHGYL